MSVTTIADEVIATWLVNQLAGQTSLNDRATRFNVIMNVLGHPVNLKILDFFYQNPTTFDSVNVIASQIGYCPVVVGQAVTTLVKAGLLCEHRVGRIQVIYLKPQTAIKDQFQHRIRT